MSGPRAKCDQVIFEAIAKAAEIIVHARSPSAYVLPMTTRFNLQVPERSEVRQSLAHVRQSLHLPLRLDIYSQSQLVERWSLEYIVQQLQHSLYGSNDSIVQLRLVCKKIVIWLRSLHVLTRMLPAFAVRSPTSVQYRLEQGTSSGSSSDGAGLPQFISKTCPPVSTPYGMLQFTVWYAPHVQKPISQPIPIVHTNSHYNTNTNTNTNTNHQQPTTNNGNNHNNNNNNAMASSPAVAKSAPTRHYLMGRTGSSVGSGIAGTLATSFDRTRLLKKTQSNLEDRSSTTPLGGEDDNTTTTTHHHHEDGRPYLRERSNSSHLSHRSALHDDPPIVMNYAYSTAPTTNRPDVPILSSQQRYYHPSSSSVSPQQYSQYAQNHPLHNNNNSNNSNNALSSTPNQPPALLSSTPPTIGFRMMPPQRMNSLSSTPPFTGLPRELSQPDLVQQQQQNSMDQQQQQQPRDLLHSSPFSKPTAFSLSDPEHASWLIRAGNNNHSNHSQHIHSNNPLMSPSSTHMGFTYFDNMMPSDDNNNNNYDINNDNDDDDDEDDMPFAVDDMEDAVNAASSTNNTTATTTGENGTSSSSLLFLAASSAYYYNPKTKHPSKQLETITQDAPAHEMSALSKQLEDFKAFGASLQ